MIEGMIELPHDDYWLLIRRWDDRDEVLAYRKPVPIDQMTALIIGRRHEANRLSNEAGRRLAHERITADWEKQR